MPELKLDLRPHTKSGKYSDYEIRCGGYVFKVHKVILSAASPYFEAAFNSSMKESMENSMPFPEDDPSTVAAVLSYVYTGDFPDYLNGLPFDVPQFICTEDRSGWSRMTDRFLSWYRLCDKFMISCAKEKAAEELLRLLWRVEDFCEFSATTEETVEASSAMIAEAADKIYNSSTDADWRLRSAIIHRILYNLQSTHQHLKWKAYRKSIDECHELGADLAISSLSEYMVCQYSGCNMFSTRQRLWICKSGKPRGCEDERCERERRARTICISCYKFGTIDFEDV